MKINILKMIVAIDTTLSKSDAVKIRGYLGNIFWDNPFAHQHNINGGYIYKYPRVQYKVIDGTCCILGFNEGVDIIKKTFYDLKQINLDGVSQAVLSKGLESYEAFFGVVDKSISYSFLTPWLALNEKNYEKYQKMGIWVKRKKFLEKILIGNIISMSKSLGYSVPTQIEPHIEKIKEVSAKLKGVPMLGFLGSFSVNFEIPDYWGIGKSVSRGFGTIIRQRPEMRRRTKVTNE